MIDPTTTGPGPAYTIIMILAIATAAILKRRGDRGVALAGRTAVGDRFGGLLRRDDRLEAAIRAGRLGGPLERPGVV